MPLLFESSVILEGSKTDVAIPCFHKVFESSVILEGSKTLSSRGIRRTPFESSVILEGSKTFTLMTRGEISLRVVLF